MQERFTPEQLQRFAELRARIAPEEIAEIERGWRELLAEVRANHDLDPASPKARELVDRWDTLAEATARYYRDTPDLAEAISKNYRDGAYEGFEQAPQAADFALIQRVKAARKDRDTGQGGGARPTAAPNT